MRLVYFGLLACCLLAASRPLAAQETRPQRTDAASKDAARRPMARAVSPDMTSHCAAINRLQSSALEAATRVQQLSRAGHMNRPAVQAQALTSHSDLQALLKELAAAESSANEEQKAVIAALLIHDREAEQHAGEMVSTADKQGSSGGDIASHAAAVIQHIGAAQEAERTDPNTGLATGRRRSLLCSAPAGGARALKQGTSTVRRATPASGQATGKRPY